MCRKRKLLNWMSGRHLDENGEFNLDELVIVTRDLWGSVHYRTQKGICLC